MENYVFFRLRNDAYYVSFAPDMVDARRLDCATWSDILRDHGRREDSVAGSIMLNAETADFIRRMASSTALR